MSNASSRSRSAASRPSSISRPSHTQASTVHCCRASISTPDRARGACYAAPRRPLRRPGGGSMQEGTFTGFTVAVTPSGVAEITFNTPERLNGLNQAIKRDLIETFTQAQMDQRVRVLLITGSGRAFCAGDDLTGRPLPADAAGTPLVPPIPHGHGNAIGTYEGLRVLSQSVNVAV